MRGGMSGFCPVKLNIETEAIEVPADQENT